MPALLSHWETSSIHALLRGDAETLDGWLARGDFRRLGLCLAWIVTGAGLYGAAMGWWRAPAQGLFVAIKFPLILLLTTLGNALLNGMLAPLLGLNLNFRQCALAILASFTIAAAILGAFSPLVAFVVWNAPPLTPGTRLTSGTYSSIQLMHVAIIAFAGIAANARLAQLLREHSGGNAALARRVLFAWLTGNLFLGSQLCWILRPFIGSPELPVEFWRQTAFQGSFFETVFRSVLRLLNII